MARKKRQKRQNIPGLAFSNETVLRPADEKERMIRELADSDATLNICLTNDFTFKTAFRNKKALTGLLSALLDMDPRQIADLEFPDTFVRGDYPEDREGILDIKVHLNSQKKINLEMQLLSFPYWEELQRLGLLHYNSASAPAAFLNTVYHKINVTLPYLFHLHIDFPCIAALYPHRRLCIICPGKLRIVEFAVDDKTGIPHLASVQHQKGINDHIGVKAFLSRPAGGHNPDRMTAHGQILGGIHRKTAVFAVPSRILFDPGAPQINIRFHQYVIHIYICRSAYAVQGGIPYDSGPAKSVAARITGL